MAQTRKTYSCYIVRKRGDGTQMFIRLPYNIVEAVFSDGANPIRQTFMELVHGGQFKDNKNEREMVYDGVWFFDKDPYPPSGDTSA